MFEGRIISKHIHLCGETPMWDSQNKVFWWSDMLAGELYRYDPATENVKRMDAGKNVSGFTMNKRSGLVCAAHQGLYLWDEKYGFTLIAAEFDGESLHSNDATADAAGRFIFGTTFYGPDSEPGKYKLGKLYSMGNDANIKIIDDGLHLSNGIAFSPDNKTMYVTDTVPRLIYAYDYDLETGNASNKRVFIQISDNQGIPDGMTVDAEGCVWSAQWYGACVMRYSPDGREIMRLRTPAEQTSSIVFGGEDLTDILVTTAGKWAKLSCVPDGYNYDLLNPGGETFLFNLGIKGIAENFADVNI